MHLLHTNDMLHCYLFRFKSHKRIDVHLVSDKCEMYIGDIKTRRRHASLQTALHISKLFTNFSAARCRAKRVEEERHVFYCCFMQWGRIGWRDGWRWLATARDGWMRHFGGTGWATARTKPETKNCIMNAKMSCLSQTLWKKAISRTRSPEY